jgi:putative transcription antitermination factor YqgF
MMRFSCLLQKCTTDEADQWSNIRQGCRNGCAQLLSQMMPGDVSAQALKAQDFAHALQLHTGVDITLWDERLSTTEAHRHLDAAGRLPSDRRAVIDQVAAVLILQSFLDSRSVLYRPEGQG